MLILAGPTGSGKSDLALELATLWQAEIVSADARQVYRGLDIGTAKPSLAQQRLVPHHLLDILNPDSRYSAARFRLDATSALEGIMRRGRRAIVVGGTGLYLKALREGLFDAPETSPEVREQVDEILNRGGRSSLVEYLAKFDPHTLASLDLLNQARLRRAVEYHLMTQESMALAREACPQPDSAYSYYAVVLLRSRAELYERIAVRTQDMLAAGWLEEVRALTERWDISLPAFDAVGYRELYDVINQRISLEEAKSRITARTRHYAKRQTTWFSHQGQWVWMSPDAGVTSKITSGLAAFAENKSA